MDLAEGIQSGLNNVQASFGGLISKVLEDETRRHVSERYPGSEHWDPDKVSASASESTGQTSRGSVEIDVAGASRAYHDVTIRPKNAECLAIPIHSTAKGKSPRDFDDLFKPKGKNVLMRRQDTGIVAMFALAEQAFQKRDATLLPTDERYAETIGERFFQELDKAIPAEMETTI